MKLLNASRRFRFCTMLVCWVVLAETCHSDTFTPVATTAETGEACFDQWGTETLRLIRDRFWSQKYGLYTEHALMPDGRHWRGSHPSFTWGVGVQLSALNAAARVDPKRYVNQAMAYADAIEVYWLDANGVAGFDVQPGPKEADRYYDDNAWLVLALLELFEISHERKYLDRAVATFDFVMSGKDDKLGGGLYWREQEKKTKNTCTNAPAIVSALRLHQLTHEKSYLDTAKQLYLWTGQHLQDTDGLFWDNIDLEGKIDRRKYSYNSALMIRANLLFHELSGADNYLTEAERIANSARAAWIRDEGAVDDSGRFAHLLLEAFLALDEHHQDGSWGQVVVRSVIYLHDQVRDADGIYGSHWIASQRRSPRKISLLDQASAARIYWLAAAHFSSEAP